MPWRTLTPDAVVVPLQYAVAVNLSREPASGCAGSRISRTLVKVRESRMLASKRYAKPSTATRVARTFRPVDRVRNIALGSPLYQTMVETAKYLLFNGLHGARGGVSEPGSWRARHDTRRAKWRWR